MDAAIGILGQTILILVAFACLLGLVFFVLVEIRWVVRIIRQLRGVQSNLPPTDAYIPESFDRMRRN
jgi:hypothetical protein